MVSVSKSEWLFAILLILLLLIGAVASVSTLEAIEALLLDVEEEQAARRIQDVLSSELRQLAERARMLSSSPALPGESPEARLLRFLEAARRGGPGIPEAVLLSADGTLSTRSQPVGADALDPVDWTVAAAALREDIPSWRGIVATDRGPALAAAVRLPAEAFPGADLLALVEPFGLERLDDLRTTYPRLLSLASRRSAGPGEMDIPLWGPDRRRVDGLVVQRDPGFRTRILHAVRLMVLGLVMGMLLLAGALGLWAVRSASQVEGLRRVGRFVNAMDYLQDGLILFDGRGRLVGANPTARAMASRPPGEEQRLQECFPQLSDRDIEVLNDRRTSRERECAWIYKGRERVWRFRSQPMEGLGLLLISDITDVRSAEWRQRQQAALQTIGRIAAGVAHDFDNILCAVSGHAALLGKRLPADGQEPVACILEQAQRGARLAAHLLDLSRIDDGEKAAARVDEALERTADMLRVVLPPDWRVDASCAPGLPPVSFPPRRFEQALLNLSLQIADHRSGPVRHLCLAAERAGGAAPSDAGPGFVALTVRSGARDGSAPYPPVPDSTGSPESTGEQGVILSVVRSMVEQAKGRLETGRDLEGGQYFRLFLPVCADGDAPPSRGLPAALAAFLGHWRILLAAPASPASEALGAYLHSLGATLVPAADLVSALAAVNGNIDFHALIISSALLGSEAGPLLRAIEKLRPRTGLVLLREERTAPPEDLPSRIVVKPADEELPALAQALLHAREQAFRQASSGHGPAKRT